MTVTIGSGDKPTFQLVRVENHVWLEVGVKEMSGSVNIFLTEELLAQLRELLREEKVAAPAAEAEVITNAEPEEELAEAESIDHRDNPIADYDLEGKDISMGLLEEVSDDIPF